MLSDFTNEYLWSRDLVKIVDNGSIKNKNKLKSNYQSIHW